MGMFGDANIAMWLKNNQKATNERLDALLAEQQATNQLLQRLIQAVEAAGGLPPYRQSVRR